MTQTTDLTQAVERRITHMIDQLRHDQPVFQDLDRTRQIRDQTDGLVQQWTPQQILDFPEEKLMRMIQNVMAIDGMAGLLNDLTPEQTRRFDEAVRRGN
jgi:hypothetical protein